MAARIPRRSFATPFVVTFTAACSTTPQPPPTQPPPTETPSGPIATAPPADPSTVDQTPPAPTPETKPPEVIHRNPPAPDVTPPPRNPPPPPPPPPPEDRQWTVFKHGAKCEALIKVECPHGAPGQAMPTCNPPPAHDYACPPGMTDTPMTIVTRGAICIVQPANTTCPPNMHCNPPPQRKVPCPE